MADNSLIKIGNDLVCFCEFSSSKEYFYKISNPSEESIIDYNNSFVHINSLLFSIKEAAYKVMLKLQFQKAFSPRKFIIESIKTTNYDEHLIAKGVIKYGIQEIFFQSFCNNFYSHSTASSQKISFDRVDIDIQSYKNLRPENQTQTAKEQLIRHLQSIIPDCKGINVIKDKVGIPVPVLGKQIIPFEVSLSHDGNYVASVIYNPKENE